MKIVGIVDQLFITSFCKLLFTIFKYITLTQHNINHKTKHRKCFKCIRPPAMIKSYLENSTDFFASVF